MTASERRAVQAALESQGNIIHPGKELNVARFQEPAQPRVKFDYVRNGRQMSYQAVWAMKNRAGYKHLTVKEFCAVLDKNG